MPVVPCGTTGYFYVYEHVAKQKALLHSIKPPSHKREGGFY